MNEIQRNAAVAALEMQPRSVVAAQAVESQTRLQRLQARLRKASEAAQEVTMEAVKVVGVVGGAAGAGLLEKQLPEYEFIGDSGIPTCAAIGGVAVVGSMFLGNEVGGIVRSLGSGMLGVAAYKLVKG